MSTRLRTCRCGILRSWKLSKSIRVRSVGTRWRGVSKILGRRSEWTTELTELQPPVRTVSRAVEGKLQFTVTNTLQPENAGTLYTYRVEADSGLGGVFGRLADPIVEKAQRRTARANLDTLAELLAHSDT